MRASGRYVVCDRGNERSRMQIFTKNGHFIRKIAIRYIDIVAGLAITQAGEQLFRYLIVSLINIEVYLFCYNLALVHLQLLSGITGLIGTKF